jgi:NitT/TauT family transport system permease protein
MATLDEARLASPRLRSGGSAREASQTGLLFVGVVAGFLVLWQILSTFDKYISSPVTVVQTLVELLGQPEFLGRILWTMRSTLIGLGIAAVVGLVVGFVLARFEILRAAYGPVVYSLMAVPKIVFYPFILYTIGLGMKAEFALAAVTAVMPIIVSIMTGVGEMPFIYRKLGRTFGLGELRFTSSVIMPSIIGSLISGLRLGFGKALTMVVLAEIFVGDVGLGSLVWVAFQRADVAEVYAIVLLTMLIAAVGNVLLGLLERAVRPDGA